LLTSREEASSVKLFCRTPGAVLVLLVLRACASSMDSNVGNGEIGAAEETFGGLTDARNLLCRGLCCDAE